MKTNFPILTFLFLCSTTMCLARNDYDCFGVLVGRNASADGSLILGHNEDDSGEQMLNMYKCPQFLWAEFPGKEVADAFMNCHGVCVVSDKCRSREDRMDVTDGGILYGIRLHVAQNAVSARDAVRIIGEDVQKFGYSQSGRSYLVADPDEGWVVSIVQGRHWVAQRVPDDMVMAIPNCYTISSVNLSDTASFAGSPDLVEYAIERGWYNPETDGEFSFRRAYGAEDTFHSVHNTGRHEAALRRISRSLEEFDEESSPFALHPDEKFSIEDVMDILKTHGEMDTTGTHPEKICVATTVVSTVFQLRNWLPLEIGCVMWMCPTKTCSQPYVPWYLGMTRTPELYHRFATVEEALEKHMSDSEDLRTRYPEGMYWKYVESWERLNADYSSCIGQRTERIDAFQKKMLQNQEKFERKLSRCSSRRASKLMDRYTARLLRKTFCQ